MHSLRCLLASCCFLIAVTASFAAEPAKRPMTVEDLWKVQRVGPPTISPDGKWCAVEVTKYDIDKNDSSSQIWLLSTDGKVQKQLTHYGELTPTNEPEASATAGKKTVAYASGSSNIKNSNPKWSPDGKLIAFISKRGGDDVPQIYVIALEGGEARRVSKMPFAPSALKWSGDSSTIYCIAWTWPDTPDDAAYKKREQERKDAKSKAVVIDSAQFRYWDKWLTDGKRPYVFSVDVGAGLHKNLMAGTGHHLPVQEPSEQHYDVAPDGKELCYVYDNVKDPGLDVNLDLFTLRLDQKDAKPKCITEDNKANDWNPSYTRTGEEIMFLRQTTKYFYADRARRVLHERASGVNKELEVEDKDLRFNGQVVSIIIDHEPNPPVGKGSGEDAGPEGVFFEAEDHGNVQIFMGFYPKHPIVAPVTLGPCDRSLSLTRSRQKEGVRWVLLRSSLTLPAAVHAPDSLRTDFYAQKPIDHFNDAPVSQWKLGKVENRTFKGADDHDVQMFIVYPPDFDPAKKWPLVQMVHGGPHNAFHNEFSFRWNPQLWAAQGWVVAIVNFHGSSSFGQEFTDSITGDLGTKPMEDIMKATDWFEQQPWIDKNRMAAAGASYGGYMMAWFNGHTDRFKAMVCHAGVYNWHSMLASDVVKPRERSLGAPPWGDLEKIDKQSPQRFAKNFKTPTLISHGEQDFRVPVTQGLEYYNTLRQKGVPTKLIYFPDENHWILKPQNSLLWHKEVFAWLEKYIGKGPTP
ncbi:MAG TPA: S9 family peptidase [Gemmataceae bacterium]|nr:S9 family peptidase [Gemmataceae bacterium]